MLYFYQRTVQLRNFYILLPISPFLSKVAPSKLSNRLPMQPPRAARQAPFKFTRDNAKAIPDNVQEATTPTADPTRDIAPFSLDLTGSNVVINRGCPPKITPIS